MCTCTYTDITTVQCCIAFLPSCSNDLCTRRCGVPLGASQDTILVDMLSGPDHSKNVSYCVTDPTVSICRDFDVFSRLFAAGFVVFTYPMAAFFFVLLFLHGARRIARANTTALKRALKNAPITTISRSFECSDVSNELSSPPSASVGGEREEHHHPSPQPAQSLPGFCLVYYART